MQPVELLVVKDLELRTGIKKIVDEYKNSDFFALEATREEWQGSPWTIETHGRWECPLAPVFIAITGRHPAAGGPAHGGPPRQAEGRLHLRIVALQRFHVHVARSHSLGLAAQPVSAVKYPKVQGLVKHLLNLPDFIYVYDIFLIGYSAMEGGPSAKLMRHLDEMVHYDRAADDEFMSEEELRSEIKKLRAGNVARHVEADKSHE